MRAYILVYTTSDAFLCEKILKTHMNLIKLVPTPREYSSDCGISVYVEGELEKLEKILKDNEVEFVLEKI